MLEVQGQGNRAISPLLSSHSSRAHSRGTQPGNILGEEEPWATGTSSAFQPPKLTLSCRSLAPRVHAPFPLLQKSWMVIYKLHPECLITEVQAVFCQHPHLVTVRSRGTWHSTWTRRSSRPSRYLSPQCNSSTGAMQCDRVTKCTVGTILSSLAFWRFPFSAWNCIFLFSRTSKITCALCFSQPRGFAKRWWSFRSETAGKDRWKTNSCTEWLEGRGGGFIIGWFRFKLATYIQCVPKAGAFFFSCIHLIKRPQDVFAKRRLKLISLL